MGEPRQADSEMPTGVPVTSTYTPPDRAKKDAKSSCPQRPAALPFAAPLFIPPVARPFFLPTLKILPVSLPATNHHTARKGVNRGIEDGRRAGDQGGYKQDKVGCIPERPHHTKKKPKGRAVEEKAPRDTQRRILCGQPVSVFSPCSFFFTAMLRVPPDLPGATFRPTVSRGSSKLYGSLLGVGRGTGRKSSGFDSSCDGMPRTQPLSSPRAEIFGPRLPLICPARNVAKLPHVKLLVASAYYDNVGGVMLTIPGRVGCVLVQLCIPAPNPAAARLRVR